MIAALKALHIAGLCIWCAMLILLPALLRSHEAILKSRDIVEAYTRFRILTHICYSFVATPAAIVTIIAGTALIFAAGVYEPWLLAKLAFVSLMVLVHAWFGHLVLLSGERELSWKMPPVMLALGLVIPAASAVLWLVLSKPDLQGLADLLPGWAQVPLGLELPALLQESLP